MQKSKEDKQYNDPQKPMKPSNFTIKNMGRI